MIQTKKHFSIGLTLLSAVATLLVALLVTTSAAYAATEETDSAERITLSPSSTTLELVAGESKRGTMKVINDGDVAYGFSVYARPYSVSNEQYQPDFTNQKVNADVYKWVQFDQTSYRIEPGQTIDIAYTIRVPAGAAPGGHYGVLFAETDERGLDSTGVARKKRVGNLLYVTVQGEYKTDGALKEFILPFWQTIAPMNSAARVENTGNADFKARVSTTAKDLFGQTKFRYTAEPIVLPGTVRLIEMKWDSSPNFGFFKVDQTVSFLDENHHSSGYVLIAPKWAPVVLIILIAAGAAYAVLQRRTTTS